MTKHNNSLLFAVFFIALVAFLFFQENTKLNNREAIKLALDEKLGSELAELELEAKAVSVYDITNDKKIYGKNDSVALPLASLAKIATVASAVEPGKEDDLIHISSEAIQQAGDFGLFANEKWRVADLARLTLVVSANDGAYALAESHADFIKKINDKLKRLGAETTILQNATGLDINIATDGGRGSAEDVNLLVRYAREAHPEIFSATTLPEITLTSESGFEHNFKNTNTLIGKIPNLLFSKTGYTEIAGGNLAIVFKDQSDREIAVTILGSTFNGRFIDMEKVVEILYNN